MLVPQWEPPWQRSWVCPALGGSWFRVPAWGLLCPWRELSVAHLTLCLSFPTHGSFRPLSSKGNRAMTCPGRSQCKPAAAVLAACRVQLLPVSEGTDAHPQGLWAQSPAWAACAIGVRDS